MKIIGLCGGSGSGKTTASRYMEKLGAAVIDADRVYRELCVPGSPLMAELTDAYGDIIVLPDGSLDRKKLAEIVFADERKRAELNAITHGHIKAETLSRISAYEKAGYPAVVVDAPLLFEAGFDRFCDITVGITAPRELRISRIIARDGITQKAAEARIASQMSDDELRARCDRIIENNSDAAMFLFYIRQFYASALHAT